MPNPENYQVDPGTEKPTPSKADIRLSRKLKQFDDLPDGALVNAQVVCAMRDRSPSSLLRDVKAGRFPPPIKTGPNSVRWRAGDIRRVLKGGV
jgi:predicted DNA-binding transcriptional regulator AlpA